MGESRSGTCRRGPRAATIVFQNGMAIINGLGSNTGMYSQDARSAWSDFPSSVGDCMGKGLETYGRTVLRDPV